MHLKNFEKYFKRRYPDIKFEKDLAKTLLKIFSRYIATNEPNILQLDLLMLNRKYSPSELLPYLKILRLYINTRNVSFPGKFERIDYCYGAFSYVYESQKLKMFNQIIDEMTSSLKEKIQSSVHTSKPVSTFFTYDNLVKIASGALIFNFLIVVGFAQTTTSEQQSTCPNVEFTDSYFPTIPLTCDTQTKTSALQTVDELFTPIAYPPGATILDADVLFFLNFHDRAHHLHYANTLLSKLSHVTYSPAPKYNVVLFEHPDFEVITGCNRYQFHHQSGYTLRIPPGDDYLCDTWNRLRSIRLMRQHQKLGSTYFTHLQDIKQNLGFYRFMYRWFGYRSSSQQELIKYMRSLNNYINSTNQHMLESILRYKPFASQIRIFVGVYHLLQHPSYQDYLLKDDLGSPGNIALREELISKNISHVILIPRK